MSIKELLPANVILLGRLLRTRAALDGWSDAEERTQRVQTLDRMRRQQPVAATGPRVLVFSFRGWYPHAAWDALIAHALRLRGASVHVFTCGGPLPICEVNFRHASPVFACAECSMYPRAIVDGLSLPQSRLHDYVTPAERAAIGRAVATIPADQLESWYFEGQPIGELVRTSVLWFCRKSELDLAGADAQIYRDFLISGASIAVLAPRLLRAVEPDVVLELNGQFFAERVFNRFVPEDRPVIAYEAGWRSNTLGFDRVSAAGPVDLDTVWDGCRQQPLSAEQAAELDNWLVTRAGGDMQRDFYVHFVQSGRDPIVSLGLDPALPTAVLFTNLVWDTAVQGRNRAFSSLKEWVNQTLSYFRSRPDRQLVIRIHPAEDLRPSQESVEKVSDALRDMGELPANVRVVGAVDSTNSYDLMRRCQVTLVYNSTAGLEAAVRGRHVVVAARVYYAERGFTTDVMTAGAYSGVLDDAFEHPLLTPAQIDLARRFAHLLMFRYLHHIPVVHQRPGRLPLLNPEEVDQLEPGTLPDLDRLLDAIASGGQFVA